jgi:hypothetical protein
LTYVLPVVTLWLRLRVLRAGCGQVAAPIVSTGSVVLLVVEDTVVAVPEGLVGAVEVGVVVGAFGAVEVGVVDGALGAVEVGVVDGAVGVLDAWQPPAAVEEDDVLVGLAVPTGVDGTVEVVEPVELELDADVDPDWAQPPSPIPCTYAFQVKPSATNCWGSDSVVCG